LELEAEAEAEAKAGALGRLDEDRDERGIEPIRRALPTTVPDPTARYPENRVNW
jgi:hypothetical protein